MSETGPSGCHPVEKMLCQPFTVLSVERYFALVQELRLPTAEQRQNFVDYVACAHSWYKHLPAFLPGATFYFYIDKASGCDWVRQQDGSYVVAERHKQGFHYSDIPTAEYHTRFGHLSYSCASGTAVFVAGGGLTLPRDKVVAIPGEDARPSYLPEPVLNAGRAEVTAVIHPNFAAYPWAALPSTEAKRGIYWPTESGGKQTLKQVFKRLTQMRASEYAVERSKRVETWLRERPACAASKDETQLSRELMWEEDPFQDPVLRELLRPERQRQKTEMLKAIDRVCLRIHEGRSAAGGSC